MFTANMQYQKTITMVTEICCNCGVAFGLPSDLQEQFKRDKEKYFYCPNGHSQHYSKSREEILKEQYEKKLLQKDNELSQLTTSKIQLENQLNKTNNDLNRLKNGVCPCCKRSFKGLHEHIKKQHPKYFTDNVSSK